MDSGLLFSKSRLWRDKADFFSPFRKAAAEAGENITPLYDPDIFRTEPEEGDLKDLNTSLAVLVDIFPDVEPEVFREMLTSIGGESRLQLVTTHLLAKDLKWIRGRYRKPQRDTTLSSRKCGTYDTLEGTTFNVPDEDLFRSDSYKKAVKRVFYLEFRNLSHSSIKAVLAEQNFSYISARPILQKLSTKPWRFSLSSLWTKRSPSSTIGEHPHIIWQSGDDANQQPVPAVKRTGSSKLDHELYNIFVGPILDGRRQQQLTDDYALATEFNDTEAGEAHALFDCECCYDSVTFEKLATCDYGFHQLCFDCVRRTTNEALYGQGWSRTVSIERSTVRCFAPTTEDCNGVILGSLLRRALSDGTDRDETWNEFQDRVAAEVLTKSNLVLQRCPFCNYAELDEIPAPQRRKAMDVWLHVVNRTSALFQVLVLLVMAALLIFTIPLALLASFAYLVIHVFPPAGSVLWSSWVRVHKQRRGLKFGCRNPVCHATSCMRCLVHWKDPHTCFENEKTSLRTAIESSATAAVKRTCPKCLLSFVKSSGCNKLVCNCGYTMCYICRQEITSKEGYGHFCQHFRPAGGRCGECERCDLYGDEDEEAAIKRAAEVAEKVWKDAEYGRAGDERATNAMVEALVGASRPRSFWESWLDAIIDAVVA